MLGPRPSVPLRQNARTLPLGGWRREWRRFGCFAGVSDITSIIAQEKTSANLKGGSFCVLILPPILGAHEAEDAAEQRRAERAGTAVDAGIAGHAGAELVGSVDDAADDGDGALRLAGRRLGG